MEIINELGQVKGKKEGIIEWDKVEQMNFVKEKCGFTEETIQFLNSYIARDELFKKLVKAMQK